MTTLTLVEHHHTKRADPRFDEADAAAFAAKNRYNAANYVLRREYIREGRFIPFAELDHIMKAHNVNCALPRKVSQLVLKRLDQN